MWPKVVPLAAGWLSHYCQCSNLAGGMWESSQWCGVSRYFFPGTQVFFSISNWLVKIQPGYVKNFKMNEIPILNLYLTNKTTGNPIMPVKPKTAWLIWWYLSNKSNFQKIFEEEMFIQNKLTTHLQIFFQFMLKFQIYFQKYHRSSSKYKWVKEDTRVAHTHCSWCSSFNGTNFRR